MSKIFSETHLSFCVFCGKQAWLREITSMNRSMHQKTLQKDTVSFLKCPTFLARIRATRRDISDGHQFSPNAFIAEHSSLCMAQSPFYTHTNIITAYKRATLQFKADPIVSIYGRANDSQFRSHHDKRPNSWHIWPLSYTTSWNIKQWNVTPHCVNLMLPSPVYPSICKLTHSSTAQSPCLIS